MVLELILLCILATIQMSIVIVIGLTTLTLWIIVGIMATILLLTARLLYIACCSRGKKHPIQETTPGYCENQATYPVQEEMEECRGERSCLMIPSLCYTKNKVKKIESKKAYEVTYNI